MSAAGSQQPAVLVQERRQRGVVQGGAGGQVPDGGNGRLGAVAELGDGLGRSMVNLICCVGTPPARTALTWRAHLLSDELAHPPAE